MRSVKRKKLVFSLDLFFYKIYFIAWVLLKSCCTEIFFSHARALKFVYDKQKIVVIYSYECNNFL